MLYFWKHAFLKLLTIHTMFICLSDNTLVFFLIIATFVHQFRFLEWIFKDSIQSYTIGEYLNQGILKKLFVCCDVTQHFFSGSVVRDFFSGKQLFITRGIFLLGVLNKGWVVVISVALEQTYIFRMA